MQKIFQQCDLCRWFNQKTLLNVTKNPPPPSGLHDDEQGQ
ncbi:hypothetical protein SynBIOSE41_02782 [Synechococcus sp. BIOS-E4-1]|nr:hypothetical protein SynBIOSE41_02782 [Synechococcus sp. BIOS-E4-1]